MTLLSSTAVVRAAVLAAAALSLSACYSRTVEHDVPVAAPVAAAPAPIVVAPAAPAPSTGTVIVRP